MAEDGDDGSSEDTTGGRSPRASGERAAGSSGGEAAESADERTGESTSDPDRDPPLSDLADRVRRSRSGREPGDAPDPAGERFTDHDGDDDPGSGATAYGDAFDAMDVAGLDAEAVWASLESDDAAARDGPAVGIGGDAERVERDALRTGRPEHVVDKAAYCQRCEYFTEPPDVACTHEGTGIVEVVDAERFRVRGCPMVDRDGPVGGRADERNG